MPPGRFDQARIRALLEVAGDRLEGDWLLIGGAAAAAWFQPSRTTEDVDLIGLSGTQAERFALMELAVDCSIPVEAVNSAADFFVRRIVGWRDELVELLRGATATIYRPSATLFLLLKLERLTEVDLEDCLALLAHCDRQREPISRERIRSRLVSLPETDDVELRNRRMRLVTRLAQA